MEWRVTEWFTLELKMAKSSEKLSKNSKGNKFSSESLVKWKKFACFFESDSLSKKENHSHHSLFRSDSLSSLFWKDRWERFAHGPSFLQSDESESLMHGRSLRRAILSKRVKCERVKEWIPNPAKITFYPNWYQQVLLECLMYICKIMWNFENLCKPKSDVTQYFGDKCQKC